MATLPDIGNYSPPWTTTLDLKPRTVVLEQYVMIRSELERSGSVISEADLWIAATALASDGMIVTNNVREFSRVPGLSVEDWTKSEVP